MKKKGQSELSDSVLCSSGTRRPTSHSFQSPDLPITGSPDLLYFPSTFFNPFSFSFAIFSTMPALRSATSLTLYSADVPITCASDDVSPKESVSQRAMLSVALRKASAMDQTRISSMLPRAGAQLQRSA